LLNLRISGHERNHFGFATKVLSFKRLSRLRSGPAQAQRILAKIGTKNADKGQSTIRFRAAHL
jgi:hypothetical protein